MCCVFEWMGMVLINRIRTQMVMEMDPSRVNHSSLMCVAAWNLKGMHRRLHFAVFRPWSSTMGTKCSWVHHKYAERNPRMVGNSIPISQILSKWIKEQKQENACEFPVEMHIKFECVQWARPTKTLPNIKHSVANAEIWFHFSSSKRKIINIKHRDWWKASRQPYVLFSARARAWILAYLSSQSHKKCIGFDSDYVCMGFLSYTLSERLSACKKLKTFYKLPLNKMWSSKWNAFNFSGVKSGALSPSVRDF